MPRPTTTVMDAMRGAMDVVDGDALRALRTAASLSGRELARRASVHHSLVSRLERDVQGDVSLAAVAALARVLGVSVDRLLARPTATATGQGPADLVADLQVEVAALATLPPDHQHQLAAVLRAYRANLPRLSTSRATSGDEASTAPRE